MKSLTFVAFSILAIALIAGFVSADTIFSDNFNDGDLNGWSIANTPEPLPQSAGFWANTGVIAVAMPGNDSTVGTSFLEKTVSTSGFQSIVVKYDRKLDGTFEPSDHFTASYTINGVDYVSLEDSSSPGDDSSFTSKTFNLLSSADDVSSFKIRFTCTTNALSESCSIDNVMIEGTPMSGGSSPSINVVKVQELTQSQNGIIRVENNGNSALSDISVTSSGDFSVSFAPSGLFDLAVGASRTITVSSDELGNLDFGSNIVTILATATGGLSDSVQFSIPGSFCEAGNQGGDLEIRNVKIDNTGSGKDDEWNLLDTVNIEVEIKNIGDDKIQDIFVELALYDSDGTNVISDLDFDNSDEEQFDLGSLSDSDRDTAIFTVRVPADFEDGSYKLAVKAYSDDVGEDEECIDTSSDLSDDTFESIDINRESDDGKFIAFDDVVLTPSQLTCGDLGTIVADVYNIGDEDQDQVKVNLRNAELGIDQSFEIRNNLDQGDNEEVRFNFQIPQNAKDKIYTLELTSQYDYNRGNYRQNSDDSHPVTLQILGCSPTTGNGGSMGGNMAAVSAFLDSDAVAGEEIVVKATITNLQSGDATYIIDADGYQSWAALDDVSDRILDLSGGESSEVTFTFIADDDAEGQNSFDIKIQNTAGGVDETKEVTVNISPKSTTGGSSFDLGNNSFLWIIGIVNVVLIVLIIVVAVRISRR